MRLIDADALVAQEEFFAKTFKGDFGEQVANHVIEVINYAPTVDAVPVIRCKDCRHWTETTKDIDDGSPYGFCRMNNCLASWKDFCSWAERKEE